MAQVKIENRREDPESLLWWSKSDIWWYIGRVEKKEPAPSNLLLGVSRRSQIPLSARTLTTVWKWGLRIDAMWVNDSQGWRDLLLSILCKWVIKKRWTSIRMWPRWVRSWVTCNNVGRKISPQFSRRTVSYANIPPFCSDLTRLYLVTVWKKGVFFWWLVCSARTFANYIWWMWCKCGLW